MKVLQAISFQWVCVLPSTNVYFALFKLSFSTPSRVYLERHFPIAHVCFIFYFVLLVVPATLLLLFIIIFSTLQIGLIFIAVDFTWYNLYFFSVQSHALCRSVNSKTKYCWCGRAHTNKMEIKTDTQYSVVHMNNGWPLKIYYESISRGDGEEREREKYTRSITLHGKFTSFPFLRLPKREKVHTSAWCCLVADVRSIRALVSDFERQERASNMPSTSASNENASWEPSIIQFLNREAEFFIARQQLQYDEQQEIQKIRKESESETEEMKTKTPSSRVRQWVEHIVN